VQDDQSDFTWGCIPTGSGEMIRGLDAKSASAAGVRLPESGLDCLMGQNLALNLASTIVYVPRLSYMCRDCLICVKTRGSGGVIRGSDAKLASR